MDSLQKAVECGPMSDGDDPRPNDGIKEGVCCLECQSVIFNVGKLLRHVENQNHHWFKSGDDLILNAKTLTEPDGNPFDE